MDDQGICKSSAPLPLQSFVSAAIWTLHEYNASLPFFFCIVFDDPPTCCAEDPDLMVALGAFWQYFCHSHWYDSLSFPSRMLWALQGPQDSWQTNDVLQDLK